MAATPPKWTLEAALSALERLASADVRAAQARFGVHAAHALGVSMPELRKLARGQRDHALAQALWETGIHEARILAALVDDPRLVTREQMDAWVSDFDSWDLCDQVCGSLFDYTPYAIVCALDWVEREEEYVRRAGFVMVAEMAVHRRDLPDEALMPFFEPITRLALDRRNFVRKAVNWALRGLGKRSPFLWEEALKTAEQLSLSPSSTARWVGMDALRELRAKGRPVEKAGKG